MAQGVILGAVKQQRAELLDELDGTLEFVGLHGGFNRLGGQVMLLIPAAGSPVEGRHARGSQRAHEQQAQHRSPQRVKAIPLALRV